MEKILTPQEQNLIKDILKIIGRDSEMNTAFAVSLNMDESKFDAMSDSIFRKMENGRLTVVGE